MRPGDLVRCYLGFNWDADVTNTHPCVVQCEAYDGHFVVCLDDKHAEQLSVIGAYEPNCGWHVIAPDVIDTITVDDLTPEQIQALAYYQLTGDLPHHRLKEQTHGQG